MFGLMQDRPLMISSILQHAARHHADAEIVTKTEAGTLHRASYMETERRARRLAQALLRLGTGDADRVGTLALNGFRHFELYYGISGLGAVCHTINPRLPPDDLVFVVNHAADRLLFVDPAFAPLAAAIASRASATLRTIVILSDRAEMADIVLPAGIELLCYEDLIAVADDGFAWPTFDERTAASLCYTSGTTGKPKGVLYSHRSTVLHAFAAISPDGYCLCATDRALPVVPMFHVNAWGLPYAAPMVGASLILPGRHLDGASLSALMNDENVTVSAGVPTVWMDLLQHLRRSGTRLHTVRRLHIGGSACPRALIEAFDREYGARVYQGWGMTETSPAAVVNRPKPANFALEGEDGLRVREKQGRPVFGIEVRVVDAAGVPLPWDGKAQGRLMVRGLWVCSGYFEEPSRSACDSEGWLDTGDIATIDPDAYVTVTDRAKDVIKSGGEWISSVQLENIAVSHPDVAEAAVIAARHPRWEERPLLLAVPKTGSDLAKADLLSIYDGKVPKWWVPNDVIVLAELPHTATGKLNKAALRERYRGHLLSRIAAE